MTTKEQEIKALEQIKKIVKRLGEGSYVGTAFEGCFEIAEENIRNDFGCSMKQKLQSASAEVKHLKANVQRLTSTLGEAQDTIKRLEAKLEKEQEWRDYEMKGNVSQRDYNKLTEQADTHYMTDDEAKDILYNWYGFAKEKVAIRNSIPKLQISRHRAIRQMGRIDRLPAYNATDWNYIRFDCGRISYELYNGDLKFFEW